MTAPLRTAIADVVGLAALGLALVLVTAGGGGLATVPEFAFHVLSLLAAGAVVVGGRARGTRAASAGALLVAVCLVGAPGGVYPFAALVQSTNVGAALLLGWAAARLAEAQRAEGSTMHVDATLALAAAGAIALQVAGGFGLVLGGRLGVAPGPRALGTFSDANHLATFLLVIAAIAITRAGASGSVARAHLVLTALATAGTLLTGSRAAPAGLALLAVVEAWRRHGQALRTAFSLRLAAASVAGLLLVAAAAITVSRAQDPDGWVRGRIWAAVAPAALERPGLGMGAGAFAHVHHRYDFARPRGLAQHGKRVTTPHGEWLRLPIETGLLGTLAAFVLVAALVRARTPGAARRGLLGPALAVVPMVLFNDVLRAPAVMAWLAVALALSPGAAPESGSSARELRSTRLPPGGVLLALALAASVVVAGAVVRPMLADLVRGEARGVARSLDLNPWHPATWARAAALAAPESQPLTPRAAFIAEASLAEAARVAPRDPRIAGDLARLAARAAHDLGDPGGTTTRLARRRFEQAAALDPFDVFLRLDAADTLLARGDAEGAARFAEAAAAVEPACVAAQALQVLAARATADGAAEAAARERLLIVRDAARARVAESPYERRILEADPRLVEEALSGAVP